MQPKHISHESFIQEVRKAASSFTWLTEEEKAKLARTKLVYGIGERGLRGVTHYGKWQNVGCKDCPTVDLAEVTAMGEESPTQLAGTTIHELGHVLAGWGSGHGPEWKAACKRLGLRHVKAAGTRYILANFQPVIRELISGMGEPHDGKPLFTDGLTGLLPSGTRGVCTQGIGTRGGKSRGLGSGSRMVKVSCPAGACNAEGASYIARVSRMWLELGAPHCPVHKLPMVGA